MNLQSRLGQVLSESYLPRTGSSVFLLKQYFDDMCKTDFDPVNNGKLHSLVLDTRMTIREFHKPVKNIEIMINEQANEI